MTNLLISPLHSIATLKMLPQLPARLIFVGPSDKMSLFLFCIAELVWRLRSNRTISMGLLHNIRVLYLCQIKDYSWKQKHDMMGNFLKTSIGKRKTGRVEKATLLNRDKQNEREMINRKLNYKHRCLRRWDTDHHHKRRSILNLLDSNFRVACLEKR